jgi:hypothetical protein
MNNHQELWQPLSRGDVIKAIERKNPRRIPLVMAKWWGEGLEEPYGKRLKQFDSYPEDVVFVWLNELIEYEKMGLSWKLPEGGAHDTRAIVCDRDDGLYQWPDCPVRCASVV